MKKKVEGIVELKDFIRYFTDNTECGLCDEESEVICVSSNSNGNGHFVIFCKECEQSIDIKSVVEEVDKNKEDEDPILNIVKKSVVNVVCTPTTQPITSNSFIDLLGGEMQAAINSQPIDNRLEKYYMIRSAEGYFKIGKEICRQRDGDTYTLLEAEKVLKNLPKNFYIVLIELNESRVNKE